MSYVTSISKFKQGRDCQLVTITDNAEKEDTKKRLVIVIARSHPSDSATSFVVQGTKLRFDHELNFNYRYRFKITNMIYFLN